MQFKDKQQKGEDVSDCAKQGYAGKPVIKVSDAVQSVIACSGLALYLFSSIYYYHRKISTS